MSVEEIADCMLSPWNIGRLKKAISVLDDDLVVTRFDYGNNKGTYSWKMDDETKKRLLKPDPAQLGLKKETEK